MKLRRKNEGGMTLVELLAAITILGIVFIGLLSVFPQMTNSNKQTEEKLETMNLVRVELTNLKDGIVTLDESDIADELYDENGGIIKRYEYLREEYGEEFSDYLFEVDYYGCPELKGNEHDESIQLNMIHIKLRKDDYTISETFGYLETNNQINGCPE